MPVSLRRFAGPAACGLALSLSCSDASASFLWFDDPSSTVATSFVSIDNNTLTRSGLASNITSQPLVDVGLFQSFMWPDANGVVDQIAVPWSNARDGWFTPNFNGTGVSLLVTLHIVGGSAPQGHVAAGTIAADATLTSVFGPTSDDLGAPFPKETLLPGDLLPFVDLGSFGPLQSKPIDLIYSFQWGDGRTCCALRVAGQANTLAPVSVPEPFSLALLGVGLAGFALMRRGST